MHSPPPSVASAFAFHPRMQDSSSLQRRTIYILFYAIYGAVSVAGARLDAVLAWINWEIFRDRTVFDASALPLCAIDIAFGGSERVCVCCCCSFPCYRRGESRVLLALGERARRPLRAPKHPLVLHSDCECTSLLQMATATAADASSDAPSPIPCLSSIFERLYF